MARVTTLGATKTDKLSGSTTIHFSTSLAAPHAEKLVLAIVDNLLVGSP